MVSFSTNENDTIVIATVNGAPLVQKELVFSLQKYTTNASGTSFLKDTLLEAAIYVKIQKQLAQKFGLINDISYRTFQKDFLAENKRRSIALQNKEVFYGPTQFTEENYFYYLFSNLVIRIKKHLADAEFNLTDELLKDYYEAIKDSLYKSSDYIQIQRFSVFLKKNKADKLHQNSVIQKIQSCISKKNVQIEELNKLFKKDAVINVETLTYDPINYQTSEGEELAEVLNKIKNTETGSFSSISIQPDSIGFYRVLQRKARGFRNFEAVKNSLKTNYIDFLYKKFLFKIRNNAIIVRF